MILNYQKPLDDLGLHVIMCHAACLMTFWWVTSQSCRPVAALLKTLHVDALACSSSLVPGLSSFLLVMVSLKAHCRFGSRRNPQVIPRLALQTSLVHISIKAMSCVVCLAILPASTPLAGHAITVTKHRL